MKMRQLPRLMASLGFTSLAVGAWAQQAAPALAAQAPVVTVAFELCGEGFAGELAALIGVEDGRRSPAGNSLLHGIHAKLHVHRIGQSPSQDLTAVPVHHSAKVQPPFVHSHIGDVHGPNLVGIRHGLIPQQVRVDLVLRMTSTGTRLAVQRRDAHALHQRAHMPAAYAMPLALQQPTQHA